MGYKRSADLSLKGDRRVGKSLPNLLNLPTLGTGSALKLKYCPENEIPLSHSQISDDNSELHKAILTFRNLL